MRSSRMISAVDSHTEGMPTRVVIGGVAPVPGTTMSDRRDWAQTHLDDLLGFLMREPHGHASMSGAILQPPTRADADWGVLYIETTGFLPMCGHGTIGVATVLIETGMVEVVEPVTVIRLDTPAGLVTAEVSVTDGRATSVTLTNVPSFVLARDQVVHVDGHGLLRYDMVYGGNFYPIVEAADLGLDVDLQHKQELIDLGLRVISAINEQNPPAHPENPSIATIHHAQFVAPGRDGADARNVVLNVPGYFDRSPCGTGTSARLALLHAQGRLGVGEEFVNESIIGSRFVGRVLETTTIAGFDAVVPSFSGRAWITGFSQHLLDPTDPFPAGFTV
ncbi:proline racemase family protein [Herbiconiux sp. KACC 21604]|uniref:proline racemase family protein n=1 Tax=unclassified Herbiconiux TaxID=2618217 RepID=UPI001492DEE0|nr:proline racemase family protein [Herbiconiux sp. SALV-R1]QJU55122.1 proline racemase family protein [Herbiconiux sp. SALV-R1]WPO86271.1 proline racemase family protein [Herbiconiux sp. KACC 21604]